MNRRLVLFAGVLVLGLAAAFIWLQQFLQTPLALPAKPYTLEVATGASLSGVAQHLASDEVLPHPAVFSLYARLSGDAARIKAGEYEIARGTTPRSLLQQLVEGRVKLHSLTVVEGWTLRELLRAVRAHPAIRQTLKLKEQTALATALGLPSEHPEGWFFPDTYHFPRGTTDREILGRAHELMKVRLTEAWQGRARDLPVKTPYEALILASIVEKETALDRERAQIAGVFSRRLERGMKLQTDPTVIYGLGEAFNGNLTRRHLERDTPYNTYTRAGLPPTPIGMPGESSLLAALHPDASDTLYFVASGADDGSHTFTSTLKEHNAAVKRYLVELREREKS
jgi:UPF0755 protein